MGNNQKKSKPKTFAEQLGSLFQGSKEAKADEPNRGMADGEASIAERINFGGRGDELKKKREKRNQSY